jgi:hypothetical protein
MLNALLLIILGLTCFIGAIVAIIFTIISFTNRKPGKFIWLTAIFVCLIGLAACIFSFVEKVVNKVEDVSNAMGRQFEDSFKNYSDSLAFHYSDSLKNNEQIQLLKNYTSDSASVPGQFYYYLGFESYYRLPLRYPYSIHCNLFRDNGELYNEKNVKRFDENDNGEILLPVDKIDRIAFDRNFLLIDRKVASTRSADYVHHYVLFSFETEKTEEADSEKELLQLATSKGYTGKPHLISLEEYSRLFQ